MQEFFKTAAQPRTPQSVMEGIVKALIYGSFILSVYDLVKGEDSPAKSGKIILGYLACILFGAAAGYFGQMAQAEPQDNNIQGVAPRNNRP